MGFLIEIRRHYLNPIRNCHEYRHQKLEQISLIRDGFLWPGRDAPLIVRSLCSVWYVREDCSWSGAWWWHAVSFPTAISLPGPNCRQWVGCCCSVFTDAFSSCMGSYVKLARSDCSLKKDSTLLGDRQDTVAGDDSYQLFEFTSAPALLCASSSVSFRCVKYRGFHHVSQQACFIKSQQGKM